MNGVGFAASAVIAGFIAFDLYSHQKKMQRLHTSQEPAVVTSIIPDTYQGPVNNSDTTASTDRTISTEPPVKQNTAQPNQTEINSETQRQILQLSKEHRFAEAEQLLLVQTHSHAQAQLSTLRAQAHRWYRGQVDQLHYSREPSELSRQFLLLSSLRDQVASPDRADCEARWYSALDLLRLELLTKRRQAVELLENGELEKLSSITNSGAAIFTSTPLESEFNTLRLLSQQAAQITWQGSWPGTLSELPETTGSAALPAASALILADQRDAGRSLLLSTPELETPQLLPKRNQLLEQGAAVIAFDRASDLSFFDFISGEPQLSNGSLNGTSEQLAEFICTVPVGGDSWELICGLTVDPQTNGEILITIGEENGSQINLKINPTAVLAHIKTDTADIEQPAGNSAKGEWHIRITAANGSLRGFINHEVAFEESLVISPGSHTQFIASQTNWHLNELLIAGQ